MIEDTNIDDVLVKVVLGESTEEELRLVREWREESAAHERYFQDFRRIWEESRNLAMRSGVDEEAAWDGFRRRVKEGKRSLVKGDIVGTDRMGEGSLARGDGMGADRVGEGSLVRDENAAAGEVGRKPGVVVEMEGARRSYRWLMAAAAVVIAAVGGWFFFSSRPAEYLAVRSGGQVLLDTLPEGSVVTLNKRSSIRYEKGFAGRDRRVDMEGEAFFAVAPDKDKPFVVHTNGMTITVLGTSFNVKNVGEKTEVIVETGMVEVRKGGQVRRIRAHEKLVVTGNGEPVTGPNPDQLYDYYRTHVFECNGTPVSRLVEKLNEVYGVHIVVENERLRNQPLSVSFVDESLERILDIVKSTFPGTQVTTNGKEIILK